MPDLIVAAWGIALIALAGLAIVALLEPSRLDGIAGLLGRSDPGTRPTRPGFGDPPGIRSFSQLLVAGVNFPRTVVEGTRRLVARTGDGLAVALGSAPPVPRGRAGAADQPAPVGGAVATDAAATDGAGASIRDQRSSDARSAPPLVAVDLDRLGGTAARRILRGDRQTLEWVVADLAGRDADARMRLQALLEAFFEAVLERALDAGLLDPPRAHAFWGIFSKEQGRAILAALASLGYRLDGLGGWLDGRVPSKRELSVALPYAGLDPARIRSWPTPTEMAGLASEVTIAGHEYLDKVAPTLALEELVAALGTEAISLAELWLHWERARVLLRAEPPG